MNHFLKTYVRRFPYFLFLLTLWFLFNLTFDLKTIFAGIVISGLMTVFTSSLLYDDRGIKFKGLSLWVLFRYFFILIGEIFKAAWSYIWTIFSKDYQVMVFDLALSFQDPIKVAFVANSITLTPGTVSVEVIGNVITVMALVKRGTDQKEVEAPIRKRFEALLKEKRQ